jgi:hypothetical protein
MEYSDANESISRKVRLVLTYTFRTYTHADLACYYNVNAESSWAGFDATPLSYAAKGGHKKVVKLLLEAHLQSRLSGGPNTLQLSISSLERGADFLETTTHSTLLVI